MIIFKELSWRNFLSTGNTPTVLKLDQAPTTLVLGVNGSGKSTMLDALCYCLFKKPFRKMKKDQLLNTINGGECELEVLFEIGARRYKIRRGIKPDLFEIYEDGSSEPRHQAAGQKDDQAYLEEDVLKVNCDGFKQVVILGNADYTPFMQLSKPDRRAFIEQILDIGVFSIMNKILNDKQTALVRKVEGIHKDININQEKIKLVADFIAKLESDRKKVTAATQRQIDEQNEIIDNLFPDIEILQAKLKVENATLANQTATFNAATQVKLDELRDVLDAEIIVLEDERKDHYEIESRIVKLNSIRPGIEQSRKNAQATLNFYLQNDSCNTCKQTIQQDFKSKIIEEKQTQVAEFEAGLTKLDNTVSGLRSDIVAIKKHNEIIQGKIAKISGDQQKEVRRILAESQIKLKEISASLQQTIEGLNDDLQTKQSAVSAARQFIQKMQADIQKAAASENIEEQQKKKDQFVATGVRLEKEKEEAVETKHYYDLAAVLLKDTGIKAAIIKQYLPTINKQVNKYLTELDFFLSFFLDENFSETLKMRHRDELSYTCLSEGEKLRIDLALLFAWRDVARMKNSCATNLLILDETLDSSLDWAGTEAFIRMVAKQVGSNTFIISHKGDLMADKFGNIVRFSKVKNFSQIMDENVAITATVNTTDGKS